jgi:hypothetical protein
MLHLCMVPVLLANVRLRCKRPTLTNPLAYYTIALITAVKSFVVQVFAFLFFRKERW